MFVLPTRANQKSSLWKKTYRRSILQTRENKKVLLSKKSSTEDRKPEIVHKSINEEKYSIDETEHEEPLVTDNPVVKELSYFNLFECGENILNRLDTTCERECMETSRDKYSPK